MGKCLVFVRLLVLEHPCLGRRFVGFRPGVRSLYTALAYPRLTTLSATSTATVTYVPV